MPRKDDHEGARRTAAPRAPEDTASVTRLFAPDHRARIAVLALFLAVTGATAALAMGLHGQSTPDRNAATLAVGQRPREQSSGSERAVTAESVDLQVVRQQDVATRQYGALVHVATHDRSSKRLAAAATALQVTITPLVARAPVSQRALDAARQLLTGEQVILATPPVSSDPQVHALLVQTEEMLNQLPPAAISSPPTAPASASAPPSVADGPTSGPARTADPAPTAAATSGGTPKATASPAATPTPADHPAPADHPTPADQPSAEPHATAAAPATPSPMP